jgi:hypothetical protein
MPRGFLSVAVLLVAALPAAAQPPNLPLRKLTVQPAAAPKPALKYLLLPEVRDLTPGNAVLAYQRAHNPEWWHGAPRTDKDWDAIELFLQTPFSQLGKLKKVPPLPTTALQEVDQAARRESCDWEQLPRLRKEGLFTLVGDVQTMRTYAQLLAVRARLELLEGKYDQALYTYQTMLAMSRHISEHPTVVSGLVACATATLALDRLDEFIEQPAAPNLYWALTHLPVPLIDLRRGLESEKIMVEVHFPEVAKLSSEKGPLPAGDLDRLTNACCNLDVGLWNKQYKAPPAEKVELVAKVVQAYPAARQALIDQGHKTAEVDALPMLQVVLIDHYHKFRTAQDELLKWTHLPFPQGYAGMKKAQAEMGELAQVQQEMWPFAEFLYPVETVYFASARVQRKIAALRCVEAVRMYAAAQGKLPGTLEDMTAVPCPADPVTGRPFQYAAAGDVFTLFGPPPAGQQAHEANVVHYQVTLKR